MKKKGIFMIALASVLALSAMGFAACEGKNPPDGGDPTDSQAWRDKEIWLDKTPIVPSEPARLPDSVAFKDVTAAVHDPSVFRDPYDGMYYAFGTHYAVASSEDLIEWKQEAGDTEFKKLYGDETYTKNGKQWPMALKETVDLVSPQVDTTWAPDVEYINGKYYMYYSLTAAFGSSNSAIARVEADNVMGPYSNNTPIVDSMTRTSNLDPNCIDPELFYDKEGKLWMVYGSDSGGIYILELYNEGAKAGLPKEGQGFGKRLWKGGSNQEGPFIFYNATTDYYYLMTSFNSLKTNYNMHVARSKNPDGPYVGADGIDVTVGDGNKIAGNFKFDRSGKGSAGWAALGHNSVIKNADGKYFVVFHARRQSGSGNNVTDGHHLYASQLYFNEDGWPVMSPTTYYGETMGVVEKENVVGEYEIVLHSTTASQNFVPSANYTLTADGKIAGAPDTDGWTLNENGFYITLTIAGTQYKGVIAPGWDMYARESAQKGVYTISAVSDTGASLWAISK